VVDGKRLNWYMCQRHFAVPLVNYIKMLQPQLTNGRPALAPWIGDVETIVGSIESARLHRKRFGGQGRHRMESGIVAADKGV
jgi:hypothetical protein